MKQLLTIILIALPCLAADETQVVLRLREASANAQGAASDTKRSIVQTLQHDLFLSSITVNSAIVMEFDTASVHGPCALRNGATGDGYGPEWLGRFTFLDQFIEPPLPSNENNMPYCDVIARVEQDAGINQSYKILHAKKSYQDRELWYFVAFPAEELNNIRIGQKISFTAKIGGVGTETAWVITQHINTETTMLKCSQGHEYAPSSGYKFCPIDGTPVK